MSRSDAKNAAYIDGIISMLDQATTRYVAEVASRIFEEVVYATVIDSGQAALHWRIEPYQGSPEVTTMVERMWGMPWLGLEAVPPAGNKWAGGANQEVVRSYLLEERLLNVETLSSRPFDGIVVYNPIDDNTTLPGLEFGEGAAYVENAFGDMMFFLETIVSVAEAEGAKAVESQYHFVRAT